MSRNSHKSLMRRHLTAEIAGALAGVRTARGFTLDDIIRSGVENPDSAIGVYAADAECYQAFAPLFDPIIADYHGFGPEQGHAGDFDPAGFDGERLDPDGRFVLSARIRIGRNLEAFPFAPGLSRTERDGVERILVAALESLPQALTGAYHPLRGMDEPTRSRLVADHFLFKAGDRFLESAGANRDWPAGRGIFHSADKRFLVWVNEEDQLRIISMQPGDDLGAVFARLALAEARLADALPFARSPRLGHLTSCPSNLGTAMRASLHIRLPRLGGSAAFAGICEDLGLSVRGIHGEHSRSEGGVWDISNKRRLGVTEVEAVRTLHGGAARLIDLERRRG